ncbi:MAG: pyridoxal phosphate-dependent aminotransferase [Pseudomonadota bacterium]
MNTGAAPSRLSSRVQDVRPSPTLNMAAMTRKLKEQGREVIILSMGEPDFDTEDFIKDAGVAAIRKNDTKYTEVGGTAEFRAALAEKFKRDNGIDYAVDQIIVSSGLKPILSNAIYATADPGDEIVIPAPYWVSYPDIAMLAGAKPVFAACHEQNGFRLDPRDLEAAIGPKTRMLILNSPNNPTGATYSAEHLSALGEVLKRHPNIIVLTDEIYEHLVYDGFKAASFAAACPDLYDRTITCNGMSKGYVMTGWRLGFAAGPRDIIKAMDTLQSQNLGSPSSISQAAAIAALQGERKREGQNSETFMERNARSFQARRDLAAEWLNRIPGLNCHKPEGSFYLYPGCAGVIGKTSPQGKRIESDEDFVLAMLEAEGIGAVHGGAFGHSPYFRISYAMEKSELEEALRRIERFCRSLH